MILRSMQYCFNDLEGSNMDEWFSTRRSGEGAVNSGMFNWLYERNNKVDGPAKCWVETVNDL